MRLPLVLPAAVLALAVASPAQAATPASGELSTAKPLLKWSGEAAGYAYSLFAEQTIAHCEAPFCDTYRFTVPAGLPEGSKVTAKVTASQSSGFTDVFFTDPAGERTYVAGESGNPSGELTYIDPAPGTYVVQTMTNAPVVLTTGAYAGRVSLVVPPPAEG